MTCRREHLRHSDIPGCVEVSADFYLAMLFGQGVGVVQTVKQSEKVTTSKAVKATTTKWKTAKPRKAKK